MVLYYVLIDHKISKNQLSTQKYLNYAWPLYESFSTAGHCFLTTNTKLVLYMYRFCTFQTLEMMREFRLPPQCR